jgi:hypothetical protein
MVVGLKLYVITKDSILNQKGSMIWESHGSIGYVIEVFVRIYNAKRVMHMFSLQSLPSCIITVGDMRGA